TSEFSHNVQAKTADAAPVITSLVVTPQVNEGGQATLTVNYSDADTLDGHTAAVSWGDGTTSAVNLTGATVELSQPYVFNGNTYYVTKVTNLLAYQAQAQAQLLGGYLASPTSKAENDFITGIIAQEYGYNQGAYI